MERSRRQPVQSSAAAKAKSALEQLRAAREGSGKRALTYEVKEEDAVYDVVDEHQYAEIVKKRRDAGAFVVDDDGTGGYADIGEDDYWNERPDGEDGEEDEGEQGSGGKHANKKRKKEHAKGTSKRKPGEGDDGVPKPEGGNITTMFRKARAWLPYLLPSISPHRKQRSAAGAAKPTDASSDDVLDSILGDLLPDVGGPATAGAMGGMPRGTPATALGAYSKPAVVRPLHMPVGATLRPGGGGGSGAYGNTVPARVGGLPAVAAMTSDTAPAAPVTAVDSATTAPAVEAAVTPLPVKQEETQNEEDEHMPDVGYPAPLPGDAGDADGEPLPAPSPLPDSSTPGSAPGPGTLPLDSNGVMPFYMLDAYENPDVRPGEVLLFGKVESEGRWLSCAVSVRGLQRCLLVVPRPEVFEDVDGSIARLEAAVKEDPSRRVELIKLLQERCSSVREEVRGLLTRAGVGSMRMVPVKRSYAFEVKDVPHGEQWVIKVRYPAHMPTVQSPTGGPPSGRTFVAIFGAQQSCLEALQLKRRIKGPGWLGVFQPQRIEYGNQATWCKVEVVVDSAKKLLSGDKGLSADVAVRKPPPLVVASLSLKTQINRTSHQHEIVAASVVHLSEVSPDAPLSTGEWGNPARLRNFSIVRRLDGQAWPHGMEPAAAAENATPRGRANGGNVISLQASERSLLTCLLARLQSLDADVLVGHNIAAFDLTTLLTRMQHHKVPLWSRIGRVKKTEFPRLTGGGHSFGGGAGPGVMSTIAGRLLCDTYLSARELVKSVDFTLSTLATNLLGQTRTDPLTGGGAPGVGDGLAGCFSSAEGVLRLLRHGESDAWLALGIMFHLSVLPLTKQLSVLSGQLWSRTLAGQRAQRIEMLLLHEFHGRKFITPDKQTYKDKQRKQQAEADEYDDAGGDDDGEDDAGGGKKGKKGKKGSASAAAAKSNGPKYSGGLVLEPKKGLYDKIVIILDFNSLYPSIIQEYNICFTTVSRPQDGSLPALPNPATAAKGLAPLPAVLQSLVNRRKQVKAAMSSERNPLTRQQLQVRQQAIKLTANSMYGCLGFGASRFYAQPLAELITAQGRSILSSTVDLVQGSIGAEVIYGDTDSIMVATHSDSVEEARELGAKIKKEVNKRYKLLEIELDGIFRSILLLKKKKYAAMKLELEPGGKVVQVMEQKGLDIVRRDWCPLSKDEGNFALSAILSGGNREEVVAEIHNHLRQTAEKLRAGQGETVPYIICVERKRDDATAAAATADGPAAAEGAPAPAAANPAPATTGGNGTSAANGGGTGCSGSLAERARHLEELRDNPSLEVDVEYYLAQQIHPVVSRLVSHIEGTDAAHIADCLGLDPTKYRGTSGAGGSGGFGGGGDEDSGLMVGSSMGTLMDEEDNFRSCSPLMLNSPNGSSFPLRGVDAVLRGEVLPDHLLTPLDALGDDTARVGLAGLVNQVLLRAHEAVARYYDGVLRPDDETAEVAGGCRAAVLRVPGGGSGGTALCHYYRLLHVEGAVRRQYCRIRAADPKSQIAMEDLRALIPEPLSRTLASAAEAVDSIRRCSHWHWVDLGKLFGCLEGAAPAARAAATDQHQQHQHQSLLAGAAAAGGGVGVGVINLGSVRGMVA
ncbi:hypothetical protein VOLCADRAFT_107737 [Volvox carteri f. nagariensis]|uniref:DNA polymerase n=1 Tax=Volvox carteri f. nagariensis TaxID=3068 RepID=D8UFZ2_VOLCA|nr:uncharacterized protein VOLCADRAFT_107737 [Volvox carteri f. nagariensis]EFJ41338.1 hypothetical protein VOLCADRAFT_107737 [Volvox carteri f. nagariensis]|eukprot:XP_002957568.1 hypothetical protein VOLCADRAFT_107737 [Volvox carteri f. nagariensis]